MRFQKPKVQKPKTDMIKSLINIGVWIVIRYAAAAANEPSIPKFHAVITVFLYQKVLFSFLQVKDREQVHINRCQSSPYTSTCAVATIAIAFIIL